MLSVENNLRKRGLVVNFEHMTLSCIRPIIAKSSEDLLLLFDDLIL